MNTPLCRAKIQVFGITQGKTTDGTTVSEEIEFFAVTEKPFDAEGASEDNSYARWTPSLSLKMNVNNPALFGKFAPGQKFYLDFTPAE